MRCPEQERQEAENLFAAEPDLVTANRTFEPGEGLAEAEAPGQADADMEAAPAEPAAQKGPTPQQLTAIKASAQRLRVVLVTCLCIVDHGPWSVGLISAQKWWCMRCSSADHAKPLSCF